MSRYWRFSKEHMQELYEKGEIIQTKPGAVPRQKRYLDEGKGTPVGTVWDDILPAGSRVPRASDIPPKNPTNSLSVFLKYPQNPMTLSSTPFVGAAPHSSPPKISTANGSASTFPPPPAASWPNASATSVKRRRTKSSGSPGAFRRPRSAPWTIEKLKALPHFEFENWAVIALGGTPNVVQVGDMGIDGRIFPVGTKPNIKGGAMFAEDWFPIQVKQADKVGRPDIDAFEAVMEREGEGGRQRGFFVSAFGFTADAQRECCAAFHKTHRPPY